MVHLLKAMEEHGTVLFPEDIRVNLDDVVGTNGEEVAIIGSVVQLAECQAVGDGRFAALSVRNDVRRVYQIDVAQIAQRTMFPVRLQDTLAKPLLVKALADPWL